VQNRTTRLRRRKQFAVIDGVRPAVEDAGWSRITARQQARRVRSIAMSRTGKTIALLAFICVSAPAFAHGGGNHGMNQSMPSHMTSPSNTAHDHNKSTQQNGKLTVQEQQKILAMISPRLSTLAPQLAAALQSGNKALAAQLLGQLKALSRLEAKFHLTTFTGVGNGGQIELGTGVHGGITLNGEPIRI
jgi:hypothetical protein